MVHRNILGERRKGTVRVSSRWFGDPTVELQPMRKSLSLMAVAALAAGLVACGHNVEQRASTGAVAGAVVGGPVGAAAGAAAGTAVSKTVDK